MKKAKQKRHLFMFISPPQLCLSFRQFTQSILSNDVRMEVLSATGPVFSLLSLVLEKITKACEMTMMSVCL
jgi:hypothetical protein